MAHLGTGSCGSVSKEPFFFIINKMWLGLGSGLGWFFLSAKEKKETVGKWQRASTGLFQR